MKKYVIVLIFLSTICSLYTQAQDLNLPIENEKMPTWAKLIYEDPISIPKLKAAYDQYYQSNPFVKNDYTRYYKRLVMQNRMNLDLQGNINSQLKNFRELEIRKIKKSIQNRSGMPAWNPYHMETFWLEKNEEACPWQSNIYAIDICRSNSNFLAAAGETGGFYITENAGKTWIQTGKEYSLGTEAIAIHPKNPDTLYLGSNQSIKKSADRGKTWTSVFTLTDLYVYDLDIPTNHGHIILAATSKGFFRSDDAGKSWKMIFPEASCDLKINPSKENIIYALKYNNATKNYEPWKSTNYGNSFVLKKNGWHNLPDGGVRMAVSFADPKRIYAIALTKDKGPYLMRSNDEGESWITQAQGSYDMNPSTSFPMDNWQGYYDLSILVSQTNADHVITGTASCFKSTDGGITFKILGGYGGNFALHPDFQASVNLGNQSWIATDGGLTFSSDFFTEVKNAEARNYGLNGSDFWGFDLGWNENIFVGGRYHNGNTVFHENYKGKFIRMGGAESPTGYVNPIKSRQVFYSDIGAYELPEKLDSNWNWFSIPNTQWPNESYYPMEFSEMVWSPICYNTLFLGRENSLWKSINNGASYDKIFTSANSGDKIEHIEICRSNPDLIYITIRNNNTNDGSILKSMDGGYHFTLLPNPIGTSGSERRVHNISVSPTDENEIFLALRTGGAKNKIFKSTNGGQTWTNLTTPILNQVSISDLCYQYGTKGGIYLACDGGLLFYRNENMQDWVLHGEGLSVDHFTRSLKPFYRDGKLFNGSNMGVWEIPFYEPSMPLAQPTVDKQISHCSRDTFYFEDYSVLLRDSTTQWEWEFPGATYVDNFNIPRPKVIYSVPGKYSVRLTVKNNLGINSKWVQDILEVGKSLCSIDSTADLMLDLSKRADFATLAKTPELKDAKGFSCTAWIKLNAPQDCFTQIISNWNSNVGFGFGFAFQGYRTTTNLTFFWKNVPYQLTSPFYLDTNKWIHVGIVVFPDSVRLYRNGESWTYKGNFKDFDFSNTPWEIGKGVPGQCGDFQGQMDELKMYNKSLSEADIRKDMHLIHPDGENGLVAYYQFNEPASIIYNKIGAFHGANGGATKTISTAPLGFGFSSKNILQPGKNVFTSCSINIDIEKVSQATKEWYTYHILNSPDSLPVINGLWDNQYWIIRSFVNSTAQSALKFEITNPQIKIEDYIFAPQYIRLYKRNEGNEFLNKWNFVANASAIDKMNHQIIFNNIPELKGQYVIEILENPFVGTLNHHKNNSLFIYPSPANDAINVSCSIITEKRKLILSDLNGKILINKNCESPYHEVLDIHTLPAGIYFISFGEWVTRFVKW